MSYEIFENIDFDNTLTLFKLCEKSPSNLNNIKIIPYSYHRCFEDGVINYVYHAGGNTLTKLERIKKMLI